MPRLLILAAGNVDGQGRLKVAREERAIRNVLSDVAPHEFEVVTALDVESGEVLRVVTGAQPDIIHFSGHGNPAVVQVADRVLSAEVILRVVKSVPRIWCVVLNACFSEEIARVLKAESIPAVVGMFTSISDAAALDFAESFYRALARTRNIANAVEEAKTQLMAAFPLESSAPNLEVGSEEVLNRLTARHSRPSIRARINLDEGKPYIWNDSNGDAYLNFDLYVHNPPVTTLSAVWRLHESYDAAADEVDEGMLRESSDSGHGFYLADIDTEDDYTVEAYLRLPRGSSLGLSATVSGAIEAHYAALSDEQLRKQGFTRNQVSRIIEALINGNLPVPK